MKKLKIITLVMMFAFLTTISGNVIADETIATPNQLIVFKINHSSYYTQEIGSSEVKSVQMDAAPFIKDSRTFVPVRFLGNALGVSDSNIAWDSAARKATLQGKLELTIGSKTMQKDGVPISMDVAPMIVNPGRTMLPARWVAEGLGFEVGWDAERQLVIAYPKGQPQPDLKAVLDELVKLENPGKLPVQNGQPGSKYNQLSAEKVAELKALPYLSTPELEMGDPRVYKALDCDDTYKGLLDKMELKPGQSFYSSKELMYMLDGVPGGSGNDYALRGVLQIVNSDGNIAERDVTAYAFYGGSSRQLEWGWHPVCFLDTRTLEGI